MKSPTLLIIIDLLRPESPRPAASGFQGLGLGLSRPEEINSCDPVTRIRHECGFLIVIHADPFTETKILLFLVHCGVK
jgi:hypothetical protein